MSNSHSRPKLDPDQFTLLTLFVLDLRLDILDGVTGLNLEGDRLPRQRLHEDLHVCRLRRER